MPTGSSGLGVIELPKELRDLIEGYVAQRHPYDESGASIYVLEKRGERKYLKVRPRGDRLWRESRVLEWIGGRLAVPEAVYYGREGSTEFLLTTEVKGTPVYLLPREERERSIRVLAGALRLIHSLDPTGCPYSYPVESKVVEAEQQGTRVEWLSADVPVERPVFTHGDYCLPNVLVDGGGLGGVIDWDYGGLADPYVDFASCVDSLTYNFGAEEAERLWAPLFFDEYGVEVDTCRLGYYRRLNQLID